MAWFQKSPSLQDQFSGIFCVHILCPHPASSSGLGEHECAISEEMGRASQAQPCCTWSGVHKIKFSLKMKGLTI